MSEIIDRTFSVTNDVNARVDTLTSIAFADGAYYKVNGEQLVPFTEKQVVLTILGTEGGSFADPMYEVAKEWNLAL